MKINGRYLYEYNGRLVSRQRIHQLRYPDRHKARAKFHEKWGSLKDLELEITKTEEHLVFLRNLREMKPQPCEICEAFPTEAHHDNYDKPLEVRWLCKVHHNEWHILKRRA